MSEAGQTTSVIVQETGRGYDPTDPGNLLSLIPLCGMWAPGYKTYNPLTHSHTHRETRKSRRPQPIATCGGMWQQLEVELETG